MQPPPPSPSPAPPSPDLQPAPAPAPSPTILLPEGRIPLEGLPRTASEVEGLNARREILRDQLSRATNRRSQLVSQLNERPGVPDEAREGIKQRLALVDERILQIEREQALTERLLSNAPPDVLAETHQPAHNQGPMVDEDDAVAAAFATFGLGVILTLFVGRMRRRMMRRRGQAMASGAPPLADDPRFERLSQAVEAMAEEVERIGEGQRFVTQLLAARRETPAVAAEAERR